MMSLLPASGRAAERREGLQELDVIGWKHAKAPVRGVATPPSLIDHLYSGDDVIRVKGDLGVVGYSGKTTRNCDAVTHIGSASIWKNQYRSLRYNLVLKRNLQLSPDPLHSTWRFLQRHWGAEPTAC